MTKEEKKKVTDFCKSYIPARARIRQAEKDMAMFEKRAATAGISSFEKELMELNISRKQQKIEEDRKIVLLFEVAMAELHGLDQCIIRQLYAEGKVQKEIVNIDGELITERRVRVIRDRALEKIGNVILTYMLQHP